MEPSKKTYKKNISNDDVFEIIEAIREHPILWADIRIGSGLFDNMRIAWNAVMATLKNKSISMIQAKSKWSVLKSKYFRLKETGVMVLKRWKFSQSLNFLDQINGRELRLDGSKAKAKKRTRAASDSDWDEDYNKRQSARSAAVTSTGKLSTSRSQHHNGNKLKTAKTERDSDWDKDHNKRQSARSAAVTSTGKLLARQSHRHNGGKLKTSRTERKTKPLSDRSALDNTYCSDIEEPSYDAAVTSSGNLSSLSHNSAIAAVTTTETSLLPTVFRPATPNETFCEYLLAELNSLTESKSRHLRRLLLQTVYDFIELDDV